MQPCREFKLVAVRECPFSDGLSLVDCAASAANYWRLHVATAAEFEPHVEYLVVLLLDDYQRLLGHHVVAKGDTSGITFEASRLFQAACASAAKGLLLIHNHPPGLVEPSGLDIETTTSLRAAGKLLRIQVHDHVIMGKPSMAGGKDYLSLKEEGYFDKRTEPVDTTPTPNILESLAAHMFKADAEVESLAMAAPTVEFVLDTVSKAIVAAVKEQLRKNLDAPADEVAPVSS